MTFIIPGTVCRARPGFNRLGHGNIYIDYLQDIGNLHVIDWWLHRATKDLISRPWFAFCQSRIGRYLDGEEEAEGTYR